MVDLLKAPQKALDAMLGRKNTPQYATRLFQLRDIPSVMRSRLGWPVAAALMERWFNGAPLAMPQEMKESRPPHRLIQLGAERLDENTVSMAWALGFARVQTAMASLQAKWSSPAGIAMLKRRVETENRGRNHQCWRFGNLSQPAKILEDTCQVNYLAFGQWSDPMDDFYGAMGEAQINVAVSGMVTPQGMGKATIEINELGFYLRDAYDFNDDNSFISQPLGCWGFNGVECGVRTQWSVPLEEVLVNESPAAVQGYKYIVQNKDFRDWRAKHQRGGDFMVLSDVRRVRLPFPQRISW
ncbi:DUF6402 family protein [Acidovorax sp. SUPP2522]|uniref:DUF6402 family protein n=1 Tax=unclassified Acidovorax TaxID=2684926 RepID=UPI002349368B|nr:MULTISPECIES: DUF6402 family protein [unclassified Acidovorax]WCM96919.1 DUF6402 family protein [Acidovorax sp. GBBC 1281]GKT15286.1 DUF6402 family protein [Acidovorax sp. SUPP2522]